MQTTLNPGDIPFTKDGMVLEATYKADSTVTDEMSAEEIQQQLSTWASDMLSDTVTTNKTAKVSDYDNRIYEVTMSASSGVRRVMPTLDLAFITDISRSMYFPATLKAEATFTQGTDKSSDYSTDSTLYDWLTNSADKDKIYYIVSSDSSATVTALYYGGKKKNKNDPDNAEEWRRIDASYLNPPDVDKLTSENDKKALKGTAVSEHGSNCVYYWNNVTGTVYTAVGTLKRMDYLKMAAKAASEVLYGVDPSAQVGLVTFAADAYDADFYSNPGTGDNKFFTALTTADLTGGTDQADGLDKGRDLFKDDGRNGNPAPKRVAILITDGAPNQSGRTDWSTVIGPAATGLKNSKGTNSVDLYTIGLSMDMVGSTNQNGLKSIATGGALPESDPNRHWFEANKGSELVEVLKAIIGKVVNEASLKGDVTDVIDEAFYPVAKNGTPLQKDMMINLDGEKIDSVPADGKYGVITYDGKNFGVKWSNQVVGYTDGPNPTWEGKFYIKAKEDFLGGNTINTNKDKDDQDKPLTVFEPKKYVIDGTDYNLLAGDDEKLKKPFETPHVNVDELTFTEMDTEWTVYLGTEITPLDQLKELLKAINVKEVVSGSTNHMRTAQDEMLGSSKTDRSETFPLFDCIRGLTPDEWAQLVGVEDEYGNIESEPVIINYSRYGHTTGKIVISLSKSGAYSDYNTHPTEETGAAVESYALTVTFIPDDPDTAKNYHTTIGGTEGEATNRIRSTNTHRINVYAKRLKINKVDQSDNPIEESAVEFKLYREAVNSDYESDYETDVPTVLPENNNYILVDTLTTEAGTATTGELSKLYQYYLVETKAPDGYYLPKGCFRPYIDTDNQSTYTTILEDPVSTSTQKWNPWILSGWEEKSTVKVECIGEDISGYAKYGKADGVAFTYDMDSNAIEWRIRNDAGVELPATGGPGTRLFTILGSILILGAGVLLWRRRRLI